MTQIRITSFFIFCFFIQLSFSQSTSNFSYPSLGYVERSPKPSAIYTSMGGISHAFSWSNHLNVQNPASYSKLRGTNFLIEGNLNVAHFKYNGQTSDQKVFYVSNFAVGLPFKKLAVAFGYRPFSYLRYSFADVEPTRNFDGSGGINQTYLGASYAITREFNIGFNANYLFGNLEKRIISERANLRMKEERITRISGGFQWDFGVYYSKNINKNTLINASVTYRPRIGLNSKSELEIQRQDTIFERSNENFVIPSKLSIGVGFEKDQHWGIGLQIDREQFSDFKVDDINLNQVLEKSLRFATGGYWIPKNNSFKSYFHRITYRMGLYYEQTHLDMKNTQLNDYGITFGASLPVSNDRVSSLNIAVELGRRAAERNMLAEENYINLKLNFSFNDLWFKKRKYN